MTTKKAFREYLNQQDAELQAAHPERGLYRNGRYRQRKRLYGDYLYAQDREKFDW